ncbi:MAG: response regulator [Pseudoxanthomonas suwonensis]|nr:response regulator [Pseudoxanthomonas suwonensis]
MNAASVRVLLIEDSSDDAELLALELLADGMAADIQRVDTKSDLDHALTGPPPDIVICDGHLPGFDAADALPWIRAAWPHVPVLLCLGHVDGSAATRELLANVDGHLDKRRLHEAAAQIRQLLG